MSGRWYRSLYWRIAIGFMLSLAAMLVVQAMLFVWVLSRSGPTLPGEPARFAQTVAVAVSEALESDAQLDVALFIRNQYKRDALPFFVLLKDGRIFSNSTAPIPDPLMELARARLQRGPGRRPGFPPPVGPMDDRRPFPREGGGEPGRNRRPGPPAGSDRERRPSSDGSGWDRRPAPDGSERDRRPPPDGAERERRPPPFGRGQPPPRDPDFRAPRLAPVLVAGALTGVVVALPRAPFGFLLRRYAPTLALAGGSVLVLGAVLTSVLIFGPARRRLRSVEDAARRLGSGDLSARAPDRGGDEVAAVATAFNTMAADLAARAEALTTADRVRRQLLADVSHELTTPVTAMRGYLETLAMPELDLDDATRARYLGIVADETARLERIIGDLLDLARLEGGGGAFTFEAVPLDELFARVIARHERTAGERGVTITSAIDAEAASVWGDRDRLEQALQNLAANALRYAPPGTRVALRAAAEAQSIRLTVTDQGSGIDPEHLPHVFDRFYKAEASRPAHRQGAGGGSGLGLSIVKAIVERHGGRISVRSTPGETIFQIEGLTKGTQHPDAGTAL
jgi:signal transduction histidine kinase